MRKNEILSLATSSNEDIFSPLMKNITTTLCAALLALSSTAAFAQEAKAAAAEETKTEAKFDREIIVTCNDTMQFDTKAIEIKANETIKLTLKNV